MSLTINQFLLIDMINFNKHYSGSKGNLYTVSDEETSLILEAGVTIRNIKKALDFKTGEYAAVLISHEHRDHCEALPEIIKSHKCYALPEVFESFNLQDHYNARFIQHKKNFIIGSLKITPFSVFHDVPNMGFVISSKHGGSLLFATDCTHFKPQFKGLTHIAIEANYSRPILDYNTKIKVVHPYVKKRVIKSHMELEETKKFLKSNDLSKVEEIHLIHCSSDNLDKDKAKKQVEELTGKTVYI